MWLRNAGHRGRMGRILRVPRRRRTILAPVTTQDIAREGLSVRRFTCWPFLLLALVLIGIGSITMAYVRSPGYRAGRAYARIHKGMTPGEAYAIIHEHGGESVNMSGKGFCDVPFYFGEHCCVGVNWGCDADGVVRVTEKFLRTPTFTRWLFDLVDSRKR